MTHVVPVRPYERPLDQQLGLQPYDQCYGRIFTTAQYFSDYYIHNASFLKLDNVTLSYLIKPCKAYSCTVYGTVQNVLCITNYKGIDPEIYSGIDNNMYPRPRTFILGVKLNF